MEDELSDGITSEKSFMRECMIISGMHRSGTSLLANLMSEAGVNVGSELKAPSDWNPRGYYEDEAVLRFHERLLRALGTTMYRSGPVDPGDIPAEFWREARELVAERTRDGGDGVWGWKDPRTCLFLRFWRQILPDAKFLFIHRDASEVLASLRRRMDSSLRFRLVGKSIAFRWLRALRMWKSYNQEILRFARRAGPKRALIVNLEDLRTGRLDRQVWREVHKAWGFELEPVEIATIYSDDLMTGGAGWLPKLLAFSDRRARYLRKELMALSIDPLGETAREACGEGRP